MAVDDVAALVHDDSLYYAVNRFVIGDHEGSLPSDALTKPLFSERVAEYFAGLSDIGVAPCHLANTVLRNESIHERASFTSRKSRTGRRASTVRTNCLARSTPASPTTMARGPTAPSFILA